MHFGNLSLLKGVKIYELYRCIYNVFHHSLFYDEGKKIHMKRCSFKARLTSSYIHEDTLTPDYSYYSDRFSNFHHQFAALRYFFVCIIFTIRILQSYSRFFSFLNCIPTFYPDHLTRSSLLLYA